MIIVIDALNRDQFGDLLDEMFRLRARVFAGRLGWEVQVQDGKEVDKFDALDPAYVIGLDDEGHVISCVRALQTTGPHMLADVFSAILDGEPPLRSATLWESTRFCVDTQRLGRGKAVGSISHATCELMIGALEYARGAGIEDIVTVIDPVMDRVLKRSDCAPHGYVGRTAPMGKVPAMAALLDCSEARIDRLRRFAGITQDVFATDAQVRALLDRAKGEAHRAENLQYLADTLSLPTEKAGVQIGSEELRSYIEGQLKTAATAEEVEAALALKTLLERLLPRASAGQVAPRLHA